jgi:NAD(P)-dependent dehydrogenase (short-subunit alcohol dehydrogenase family)
MPDRPSFVIVGAAGGIGAEVCRRLAAAGANLLLAGRSADKLGVLAAELRAVNPAGDYHPHPLDATKSAEVDAAFTAAVGRFGSLAGATNLVGSILLKPAHLTTDDEFEHTLSLNLRTAFYVTRAAAKAMLTTGGSIVLASTVAARIGLANHEAIAAAKGGVSGLVLAAAASYAGRNVRVNAVAPGLVDTPLAGKITGSELALKASTAMHPLGRIGKPADVAAVVCLLLDPASAWITGQVVGIDGGLGSVRK